MCWLEAVFKPKNTGIKIFRILGISVVSAILLVSIGQIKDVSAHGVGPTQVIPLHLGSYKINLSFYTAQPRSEQPLIFSIDPDGLANGQLDYTVQAVNGPIGKQMVSNIPIQPHPDDPKGVQGSFTPSVSGQWALRISVKGDRGTVGPIDVPFSVSGPPAIPVWLGWVIGLLPVYCIFGYLLLARRRA